MAFTSETILKFGNDYVEFAVGTLLNYSIQNQKAGSLDYRRIENISVTGLFSNRESSVPISEHFRQVKLLLESSTDFVNLSINDQPYGKVRFLSFDYPTSVSFDENSIRFTKFTISMEVFKDDSSGTFATANLPSSISSVTNDWYKLNNFNEDFSFALQQDNNFLVTHNISFGVDNIDKDTPANVAAFANNIANQLFVQGLDSLSDIRSLYSSTSFQIANNDYGSSLVSQNVDLVNYTFSYTKNYTLFSDNASTFTETITTNISYGEDGVIQVIEAGRIKGKGTTNATARQNAISRLNTNLTNAYTSRCNPYFQKYFVTNYSDFQTLVPNYNVGDTLQSNPISISKDLSGVENEVGYEIVFTTNKAYSDSTRIHEYTVNVTENKEGVVQAIVQGNLSYYTNKQVTFNKISDFKTYLFSTFSDVNAISPYYKAIKSTASNYNGTRIRTNFRYSKFGVSLSYTKTYSDSPSFNTGSNLVSSIEVSENDNEPINKYSTVNVPNGKEILYQRRQLGEGNRNLSIAMTINREELFASSSSGANQSPTVVFSKIKDLLTTNMIDKNSGYLLGGSNPRLIQIFNKIYNNTYYNIGDLTFFMDSLNLNISEDYNLTVSANFIYLTKQEKAI